MIVDASVAVKWVIEEEGSDVARALLGRVDLVAPTLIHAEVANAIWKKQRRGEYARDADLATLPELFASLIQTIDESSMMARALQLAIDFDHAVYGCVYLAMAEALDSELITADVKFARTLAGTSAATRVRMLA